MLYYDNNLENVLLSVKWRHLVVWYANKCENLRLNVNNHCGLPTNTCILYIYIYIYITSWSVGPYITFQHVSQILMLPLLLLLYYYYKI